METHIFPFLWIHGEELEKIENEIQQIYNCGIRAFCVESRPHPQFCEKKWWEDFEFILESAKSKGMKVWLLDDKHFPTGYANGAVERHADLKQQYIRAFHVDVVGEKPSSKILVSDSWRKDEFLGAFAFLREGDGINYESGIDISDTFHDNLLYYDIPKGFYRIVVLFKTTDNSELENYIDMLNPESCKLLLSEVYESHYLHFKKYFGNTFEGFFSDEPRFSNGKSEGNWVMRSMYQTTLGLIGVVYPYRKDLPLLIKRELKEFVGLWYDIGAKTQEFRIAYMNVITQLYSTNFSKMLGDWCISKKVQYVGHITEDMGNHCRLGSGAGHFFRAMTGQTMSGIDVVLHQIKPFFSEEKHIYPVPELYSNPDFFHFTLAKLATSAAYLEKRKAGRAMCEIFGAYGWSESINEMKWLVDFMLVRGINYFVPHAFNPKFDDEDCPPYFYHNGTNPQFSAFKELMKYTESMCEILDKKESMQIAILYHAESEWSGKNYMPCDTVCRVLSQNQIDFIIIPSEQIDAFNEKNNLLIIPFAESLGKDVEKKVENFEGKIYNYMQDDVVEEKKLVNYIRQNGLCEYHLKTPNKWIRVLKRGDKFMLFNEGIQIARNSLVTLKTEIKFELCSGESIIIDENYIMPNKKTIKVLDDVCDIYIKSIEENEYKFYKKGSLLSDINSLNNLPNFVGKVKYVLKFELEKHKSRLELNFGMINGGLKVSLNDYNFDELFSAPYCLDVTNQIIKGENNLVLELSSTLALKYKDNFSKYSPIEKLGLNDKILLVKLD